MEVRLLLHPASIDFRRLTYVYSCCKVRATHLTTFQEPTAIKVWGGGGITVSIQTVSKIDTPEGPVFLSLQRWLRQWVLQDFPFFLEDENVFERERERSRQKSENHHQISCNCFPSNRTTPGGPTRRRLPLIADQATLQIKELGPWKSDRDIRTRNDSRGQCRNAITKPSFYNVL